MRMALLAVGVGLHGGLGCEHYLTYGSARRCRKTDCKHLGLLLRRWVEDRVEDLVEL